MRTLIEGMTSNTSGDCNKIALGADDPLTVGQSNIIPKVLKFKFLVSMNKC